MNDSEIIKTLEYCITNGGCYNCPHPCNACNDKEITECAYDLIKRQQAEIDRLNIDLKAMRGAANSYKAHYEDLKSENLETIKILKTTKSEAVREFAERYKDIAYKDLFFGVIDRLLEEMGCNDGK